jgi:hypothetical protein
MGFIYVQEILMHVTISNKIKIQHTVLSRIVNSKLFLKIIIL